VGCGPAELQAFCACLDRSYLFQYFNQQPPLCDCTAIRDQVLCQRYPRECTWSEELGACETIE
jgi:hypothetical protein